MGGRGDRRTPHASNEGEGVAGDIPPMQGRIISCYKRRARRAFERTASLLVSQPAPSGRKTSSSLRLVIGHAG
jgi:hypothetical protein